MQPRPQQALRFFCLAYFALMAANYMASAIEEERLPEALRVWRSTNPAPPAYSIGASVTVVGLLVGTAGLLLRKGWALYVHLASTVLLVALGYVAGPAVAAGPNAVIATAIYVVTGLIYGLAFFTEALEPPDVSG